MATFTEEELRAAGLTVDMLPIDAQPTVTRQTTLAAGQMDSSFVIPDWFVELELAVQFRSGALVFGPRGSGKDTAITNLAKKHEANLILLKCFTNMQVENVVGGWQAKDGSTVWGDAELTTVLRECNAGRKTWLGIVEINAGHPGVWSAMNGLLDNSKSPLRLPNGEVIPWHPDLRVFGMYNPAYTGMREVNEALKDRLAPVYATYPKHDQEAKILAHMTGAPMSRINKVLDVATAIRAANENLRFDLSVRPLSLWILSAMSGLMTWTRAYEFAVVNLIGSPAEAQGKREALLEIGRNSGIARWDVTT